MDSDISPEETYQDRRSSQAAAISGNVTQRSVEVLEAQIATLHEQANALAAILSSATEDAIIALNLDGEVIYWNTGAERITGYAAAEVLGHSADLLFTPEDRSAGHFVDALRLTLDHGRAPNECWHLHKDGTRFWANGSMLPLLDADGHARGILNTFCDCTADRVEVEHRDLLMGEMQHRIGTTLAVIQSMTTQTARHGVQPHEFLPASALASSVEEKRLWSLQKTGLLDTPADPRFDWPAELAARLFNVPIALVSLMDGERQWFKAAIGFAQGGGTSRSDAFCAHTILDPTKPLVVPDAWDDPRFATLPLVTGCESIRFYAGAPILDVEGHALGSLCILDTKPRHLSPQEVRTLTDLAHCVSSIVQMEQAATACQASEEHRHWAMVLSPQSQWVADPAGNILEISPRLLEQLGMTLDKVHGDGWIEAVLPVDQSRVKETWRHSLRTGEMLDYEFRLCMADGADRWVRSRAKPRRDVTGRIVRWYGTVEDVDDRIRIELVAKEGQQRLETVLESTTDFVTLYDNDWRVTYVCPRMRRVEGYSGLLGSIIWEALPELLGTAVEKGLRQAKDSGLPVILEMYSIRRKGWIEVNIYPSEYGIATFARDVDEQYQLRSQLLHQARHDLVTGLPNRAFLQEELQKRINVRNEDQAPEILLRLRVNDFWTASDTFGPAVSQILMQDMAERLKQCVTDGCFVARLDGPEFAVIPAQEMQDQEPGALAAAMLEVMEQPYNLNNNTMRFQVSVGIARAPEDAQDADHLLQAAEIAMSQARRIGGQGFGRFTSGMLRGLENRHQLLLDLRKAVSHHELSLAYQPLVDFPRGRISGFEALMRWHHPVRGVVSPVEFISVAEESGLIVEIGAYALRRACEEAKLWHKPARVAVNLSPVQFRDPGLVKSIAGILAETAFPASRLKLEITETVLLEDSDANIKTLHQLRELGTRIVLDDFGTGYSSLAYLQKFPFDRLKIDQSFIGSLMHRSENQAIVRSILALARSLRIGTTAEGIETEEQLQWLVWEGCGQFQGYLFGKPLPAELVNDFLREFVCPHTD